MEQAQITFPEVVEKKIWTPEDVKAATPEMFWSKIKFGEADECWEWQAYKDKLGYGKWKYYSCPVKEIAHQTLTYRFLFMILNEILPRNIEVMHKCDNRPCCNPNHLSSGTHQENMDDMARKGREKHVRGSDNWISKLKEKDIPIIRERLQSGESGVNLAREYNVTASAISSINVGKTWCHV